MLWLDLQRPPTPLQYQDNLVWQAAFISDDALKTLVAEKITEHPMSQPSHSGNTA